MAAAVGAGASSSNMYRVGDYVFFENSASGPYAIRRIEELNKTATGQIWSKLSSMFWLLYGQLIALTVGWMTGYLCGPS